MAPLQPQKCIGIEQDQRRPRLVAAKQTPSGSHSHFHSPATTAGSTISITGVRGVLFGVACLSVCEGENAPLAARSEQTRPVPPRQEDEKIVVSLSQPYTVS